MDGIGERGTLVGCWIADDHPKNGRRPPLHRSNRSNEPIAWMEMEWSKASIPKGGARTCLDGMDKWADGSSVGVGQETQKEPTGLSSRASSCASFLLRSFWVRVPGPLGDPTEPRAAWTRSGIAVDAANWAAGRVGCLPIDRSRRPAPWDDDDDARMTHSRCSYPAAPRRTTPTTPTPNTQAEQEGLRMNGQPPFYPPPPRGPPYPP